MGWASKLRWFKSAKVRAQDDIKMSTVQLNTHGSPYHYRNGRIWCHADKFDDRPDEVIVHENDIILVHPGTRMSIGLDDGMVSDFDLYGLLNRCEATRDKVVDGYIFETNLNTLRVIALYYTNIGYAGMNVGEFLRRTLINGKDNKA